MELKPLIAAILMMVAILFGTADFSPMEKCYDSTKESSRNRDTD